MIWGLIFLFGFVNSIRFIKKFSGKNICSMDINITKITAAGISNLRLQVFSMKKLEIIYLKQQFPPPTDKCKMII